MLKYAKIEGYNNLGEVDHHLYQWIREEPDKDGLRTVILIRAYDVTPVLFKGYILNNTKEYKSISLVEDVKEVVELVGAFKVVKDPKELSSNVREMLIDYKEVG